MTAPAIRDTRYAIRPIWLMVSILLIAAVFRFLAIDTAPPGWRDDELIEFGMDQRIVQGWRPLFITEAEGHEPFYHYLHAETITLFGENIVGYKWLPFAFGTLTVALTYALARRMFGSRVGLLAAALMAVSFWPVMYARFGLRHIGILPLMLGAFLLLYPDLAAKSAGDAKNSNEKTRALRALGGKVCAGMLLAAALMTYFAGRAVPLIVIGFLIYLLVFNRPVLRPVWLGVLGALAIGALIAAPMFVEIANTPGAEKRTEVVGSPLIAARTGNLKPVIETTLGTLGMFTFAGDPESLYNISGRPVFDGLTGIAFYLGVLLCLVRIKQASAGFALVWLVIGIAPAFVSLPAASFSHTIAAMPVVYILTAYGTVAVVDKVTRRQGDKENGRTGEREKPLSPLLLFSLSPLLFVGSLLIGLNAFLTMRDYFGVWASDPFVRFQYHGPTRAIARWLDRRPNVKSVAVGTHPNLFTLDPLALQLDLKREDVTARWFDPQAALVLPRDGIVILSPMQSPGHEIEKILQVEGRLEQRVSGPDGRPVFDLYSLIPSIGGFPPPGGTLDQSTLLLNGVESPSLTAQPGGSLAWKTSWLLDKPPSYSRLKLFVHVLNSQNQVVAGEDREAISFSSLQAGDGFWQVTQLRLPVDLAPGRYSVEAGWYQPDTGARLRRSDGTDRFLLNPIEVTAP